MFKNFYNLNLYIIFHPFKGFDKMKYQKKGTKKAIVLNIFLFWIVYTIWQQFAGYNVHYVDPLAINSFQDLYGFTLVFFALCVANWAVTSLIDGEGRFVEIAMMFAYSLTPIVVLWVPMTILSNFLTRDEAGFVMMIYSFSFVWVGLLLFIGLIIIHNFTVFKTIAVILLTIASLMVILYIGLLVSSLVGQVIAYIFGIYREISLRG